MADMTASGWYPSNVQVIRSWRPWGPQTLKHSLVQLTMEATQFGGGAQVYPQSAGGIPAPFPSTVGFQQSIEYIIPVAAFTHVTKSGRYLNWSCSPPTYGASGGTVSTGCCIKVQGFKVTNIGVTTVTGAGFGETAEAASGYAASDLFTTDTMRAYGIFVGR